MGEPVYVFGVTIYSDIFGDLHCTHWCTEFSDEGVGRSYCRQGNTLKSGEECQVSQKN